MLTMTTKRVNYFQDWLWEQINERGWKPPDLARKLTMAPNTINQWLTSWVFPNYHAREMLAEVLEVDVSVIEDLIERTKASMGRKTARKTQAQLDTVTLGGAITAMQNIFKQVVEIPVFDISAGPGSPADHTFFLPAELVPSKNVVAYQVHGSCMEPDVPDDSYVMIDRDQEPKPGDIVAAVGTDGVMLKRLMQKDGRLVLTGNDGSEVQLEDGSVYIEGVACGIYRRL